MLEYILGSQHFKETQIFNEHPVDGLLCLIVSHIQIDKLFCRCCFAYNNFKNSPHQAYVEKHLQKVPGAHFK